MVYQLIVIVMLKLVLQYIIFLVQFSSVMVAVKPRFIKPKNWLIVELR
jgi:hypothetical protein